MKLPLQITFRHMAQSPTLKARIELLAERLNEFSAHIMRCHVTVSLPHAHKSRGKLFEVKLEITVPGADITLSRTHHAHHEHADAYLALSNAFRAARRRLQDYERKRRLDVKSHSLPADAN